MGTLHGARDDLECSEREPSRRNIVEETRLDFYHRGNTKPSPSLGAEAHLQLDAMC